MSAELLQSLLTQSEALKAALLELETLACAETPPPAPVLRIRFQLARVRLGDFLGRVIAELEWREPGTV